MKVVLNSEQIESVLGELAERIAKDISSAGRIAIIGIRSRGEILAQRLSVLLSEILREELLCGTLDITLYRDDLNEPQADEQPTVRSTEISFDVNGKTVFLVDDVLYTGRSVRAAMDALMDLGRPKAIRLAVLIDRGHHELPIQADYTGRKVDIADGKNVEVHLVETDDEDCVIVK